MKYVVICLVALISGCAQIQSKLDSDVQTLTVPDVQAALADAKAANNTDGIACWTDWLAYINSLPTNSSSTPLPKVIGAATIIEAASEASQATGAPIAFPPIPHQLHKDCAVLIVDAQTVALKLGLGAQALTKGVGIVKAVNQLPVKP